MTFKKEYKAPASIEPEIAQEMTGGVMKVSPLTLKESRLGDESKTAVYQLWCHSPRVKNDSIGLCNHSIAAIVADTDGHSITSMLLECPKCRTSYAVVVELSKGEPVKLLSSKVVSLNRSVQQFVDVSLDTEKDTWIQIHEKKS